MRAEITSIGNVHTCAMIYTARDGQVYRTVAIADTNSNAIKLAIDRILLALMN